MRPQREHIAPSMTESYYFQRRRGEPLAVGWHFHPEIELCLVEKCRGQLFVGDFLGAYAGADLVLLGANLPHAWQAKRTGRGQSRGHEAWFVQFSGDIFPADFLALPELHAVQNLLLRSQRGLRFHGRTRTAVSRALKSIGRSRGIQRITTLLDILNRLAISREVTPLSTTGVLSAPDQLIGNEKSRGRFAQVLAYIRDHYTETLSQAEVARHVRLSVGGFSRFFRRAAGLSFPGYVNRLRVGFACQLLLAGELTITEICFRTGFGNLANFNRQFRAIKKLSPREFRQAATIGGSR